MLCELEIPSTGQRETDGRRAWRCKEILFSPATRFVADHAVVMTVHSER